MKITKQTGDQTMNFENQDMQAREEAQQEARERQAELDRCMIRIDQVDALETMISATSIAGVLEDLSMVCWLKIRTGGRTLTQDSHVSDDWETLSRQLQQIADRCPARLSQKEQKP